MPGYTRWTAHEDHPIVSSTKMEEQSYSSSDPLSDMLVDVGDATRFDGVEIEPAADVNAFHKMVSAAEEPLYGSTHVSCLSAVKLLMEVKSQHNLSEECVNEILALMGDALPEGHKMPASWNECENMLSGIKMPDIKIAWCTRRRMGIKRSVIFVEKVGMKSLRGEAQRGSRVVFLRK